ncbi:tetratricopeptide repeat protein [Brevundimonas sp. TWP2-3-4b2]|uniref:tetratricopeptide repeat protein n=1 Tax=Brevundimonas sp. TWP2-3-4b2 TaxID=2804595 RepID=UPI003CEA2765
MSFRRIQVSEVASYVLTVGAVVLAWQMATQPIIQRAPVEIAIRIAPESPLVLRRAAEAELAAGRVDDAAALGREALGHSPFDVRALRVIGLTEARAERRDRADEILTLAGNWSLRDDPAHAWLVEHRLRRGDYASAFAHADTLARRREDIHPQLFRLFTVAAAEDPQRVLPVLTSLLAARPPWRSTFLSSLYDANGGLQVVASLAVLLQSSRAPLSTAELQEFYSQMMGRGQIEAIKTVRTRLNRPRTDTAVTNGGFDDQTAPEPFQWSLIQKAGAVAQVIEDDTDRGNPALRVEYDGYATAIMARQQTFLSGGRYSLRTQSRTEAGEPTGRMEWTITCAPGGDRLASVPAVPATGAGNNAWVKSTVEFSVSTACPAQWLELRGLPLDRRAPMVVWFDRIAITPLDPTRNER